MPRRFALRQLRPRVAVIVGAVDVAIRAADVVAIFLVFALVEKRIGPQPRHLSLDRRLALGIPDGRTARPKRDGDGLIMEIARARASTRRPCPLHAPATISAPA